MHSRDDQEEIRINRFGNCQANIDKVILSVTYSGKWESGSERRNMFIKLCSATVLPNWHL